MAVVSLLEQLAHVVGQAFSENGYPSERGRVVVSGRPDLAQFQCNGAMACAKEAKKNPLEIAEAIAQTLQKQASVFAKIEVAKPGFLNMHLQDSFLAAHIQAMANDTKFGAVQADKPLTVMLDYGGMNVAKPMHVGHLRASVIGDSLYRLFKFLGHRVISDIHLGDWGLQMGMLISEIAKRNPDLPYFEPGRKEGFPKESPVTLIELETLYPEAAADCKADPARMELARAATQALQDGHAGYRALWKHFIAVSVDKVKETLADLDIGFDLWLGESDVQAEIPAMVEAMKAKAVAHLSEGALVIDIVEPGDKQEMPPLLLIKSDGAALYSTTDLATIKQRVDRYDPDIILYVVDQRQHLHFEQVFRAARKSGIAGKAQMEHLGFGTVNGKDGKPFKTREGGVMKLEDLIDLCVDEVKIKQENISFELAKTIGVAALKFADLSGQRIAGYVFDVEKFISTEGRTGPYLQYACVRVQSMLHKTEIAPGAIQFHAKEERDLALLVARFPEALRDAAAAREPSLICEYAYTLAQAFSSFYAACPIAKADDPIIAASRITLSKLVHGQISTCLNLVGIRVPAKM